MRNPKLITIIKSEDQRQIQFAGLVIGVKETKEESVEFAKGFEHGERVEVWEDEVMVESFEKN